MSARPRLGPERARSVAARSPRGRGALFAVVAVVVGGRALPADGQEAPRATRSEVAGSELAGSEVAGSERRGAEMSGEPAAAIAAPSSTLRVVPLSAGRTVVDVALPSDRYVTLGVFGDAEALLDFDVVGSARAVPVRTNGALDEDGMLPRVAAFAPAPEPAQVRAIVELARPGELRVSTVDPGDDRPRSPRALRSGEEALRALVGLPAPASGMDGYFLQSPSRYHFLRVDVANVLRGALRESARRFRAGPIAIADVSQWDGNRPATDRGLPRHISHVGGRDVDIALPANDGIPSTVRDHCRGVLVEEDRKGCAPGTVQGLDALRLAHLLGAIVDASPPGLVTKVYLDEAYLREVQRVLPELEARRWIGDEGWQALGEDGVLVASPWHTDHVHVRFGGEPGGPSLGDGPPDDLYYRGYVPAR